MASLLIAASTNAEMRYASGLRITDPFILLDTGRKRHVLVSPTKYGLAREMLKGKKGVLLVPTDFDKLMKKIGRGGERRSAPFLALIAAAYLKEKGIRKVVMPRNSWASHVEQLRKEGIKVALASSPLYPERAIKTKEELREILKVRDATVAALDRCVSILKQSKLSRVSERRTGASSCTRTNNNIRNELVFQNEKLTSEFLRAEARKILVEYECEAPDLIISHGDQTASPHDEGRGAIRAGEPIVLDFFPRSMVSGYWFDMTRTVCKGAPSPVLKRQWDAVKAAQDAALKMIRPGVKTGAIHAAALEIFEKRGFKTDDKQGFIHGTGHGVGLEIHEAPSLGEDKTEVLREGMVLTVEPGLYYRTSGGVRLENTILVTKAGYKDMTKYPRVLQL